MTAKILIADDEPHIVESLKFLFEHQGYQVTSAGDGRQALEMLERVCPDLLVLDAMMQHHSGFDVLKLMRADPNFRNVKVLMLTAKGRDSDKQLALELGADHYIAKPYANKDVIAAVSELLQAGD